MENIKIGEFAKLCNTTIKTLRYYDKIGLLKPHVIDDFTGYRLYSEAQIKFVNWVSILKNLDFTLKEISDILSNPLDDMEFLRILYRKRLEIGLAMDFHITKQVQIQRLIKIVEEEGFNMEKNLVLMDISAENVNDILKNMPNTHQFLEKTYNILKENKGEKEIAAIRIDIYHFKSVNDDLGFEVGDKVIAAVYNIFSDGLKKYCSGKCAAGRSDGDEFIAIALCGEEQAENMCKNIISDMESYDFGLLGCDRNIGVRYGISIADIEGNDIRDILESTYELVIEASKIGKNAIVCKRYKKL